MVIISESARTLKGFVGKTGLKSLAAAMVMRMVLALMGHRGRCRVRRLREVCRPRRCIRNC